MDCHVLSSNLEVAAEATSFFRPCDIFTPTEKKIYFGGRYYEKEFNRNRIYFRQKRIHV